MLIDADAYFRAFRSALECAERAIWMIGWDVHTQVVLPGTAADPRPRALGKVLRDLVGRRRDLEIYVLDWDYILFYALDRELAPGFRWRIHPRIHFRLDGAVPYGASQHQKIVVVDDAIAFSGGLDLAVGRWDTPAHAADEPNRRDPKGRPYPPFHDAMLAVDGDAAASLGDIARERWFRATGDRVRTSRPHCDPWPADVEPEFRDVDVAIARTIAAHDRRPAVTEIETLYLDAIAAARRTIYFENQYFTASSIVDALAKRLGEEDGPEVVVVTTQECLGWLEQATMGALRSRAIRKLRAADRFDRFRVFYPVVPNVGAPGLKVHSKLAIFDDAMVRVGSANLANRSMSLDTECDLAIEAEGDVERARAIGAIRARFVAEHLGADPRAFAASEAQLGSFVRAIEAANHGARHLENVEAADMDWVEDVLPPTVFADPTEPVAAERVIESFFPAVPGSTRRRFARKILLIGAILAVTLGWSWTPLGEVLDPQQLAARAADWVSSPWAPLWILGAYVAAALVALPLNLLIVATAFALPPLGALFYAFTGAMLGAVVTYGVGRMLGPRFVRRMAGHRIHRAARKLSDRGLLAMVLLRIIPIAPFTLVNVAAGALRLRFRDFVVGSAIGLAPGIATIALLGVQIEKAILSPSPRTLIPLVALLALIGFAAVMLHRKRREVDSSA